MVRPMLPQEKLDLDAGSHTSTRWFVFSFYFVKATSLLAETFMNVKCGLNKSASVKVDMRDEQLLAAGGARGR